MKEPKYTLIRETEDFTVDKCEFEDLPIIGFTSIDSDILFYSVETSALSFKIANDKGIKYEDITNDDLADMMIEDYPKYLELYEKAVKEDDPSIATTYHNKRDLVKQSMKLILSDNFSDMALYNYLVDTYSRIEDGFEHMFLFIDLIHSKVKKQVLERIKKDLKEYQNLDTDKVLVYRGFNKYSREDGTSYTFSYKTAKFFADRWNSEGYVNMYEVEVKDILAYIHHEEEIITNNAKLLEINVK